jgi:hypothetical protein
LLLCCVVAQLSDCTRSCCCCVVAKLSVCTRVYQGLEAQQQSWLPPDWKIFKCWKAGQDLNIYGSQSICWANKKKECAIVFVHFLKDENRTEKTYRGQSHKDNFDDIHPLTFFSWLVTNMDLSYILDFLKYHQASLWISFPHLGGGWMESVFLSTFVYIKSMLFTYFWKMFVLKYFIVLWNRLKTNKNPDEKPDLTIDFKNLDLKLKVSDYLWLQNLNLGLLGKKTKRLDPEVKNPWKIYRLAYGFCFFVISTSRKVFTYFVRYFPPAGICGSLLDCNVLSACSDGVKDYKINVFFKL